MEYVNTSALALLATHPRAVYRVTLEKTASALSYWTGDWPTVVAHTAERATMAGYGFALGGPLPSSNDRVAILDFRAPSDPATGDSVGDLVTAVEAASIGSRVVKIQRLDAVPPTGSELEAERAAAADAEQRRAEAAAEQNTIGARIQRGISAAGRPLVIGVASALVLLGLYYFGRRTGGGSQVWTGAE